MTEEEWFKAQLARVEAELGQIRARLHQLADDQLNGGEEAAAPPAAH